MDSRVPMLMSRTNNGWPVHTPGARNGGGRRGAAVSGARERASELRLRAPGSTRLAKRNPLSSWITRRCACTPGARVRRQLRRLGRGATAARCHRLDGAEPADVWARGGARCAHLFPLTEAQVLRGYRGQHASRRRAWRLRAREPVGAGLCFLQLGAVRAGGQLLRLARPGLLRSVLAARQRVHGASFIASGAEAASGRSCGAFASRTHLQPLLRLYRLHGAAFAHQLSWARA